MNEKELREALLGLDSTRLTAVPDAHQLTRQILERDGRRVRLLAGLTIVLWAIAASGIIVVLYALLALHPEQRKLARDVEQGRVTPAERERIEQVHWAVIEKTTAVVAISVAVLALAALGTVFLVFASRGATIRQVNATLLEISEQLKLLKQAGPR
jgi:uncharacterized membrane protein